MKPVKILDLISEEEFSEKVSSLRLPAIIRNIDIGTCVSKWTVDYLISKVSSEKRVKVHRSSHPQLDFRKKNFTYETVSFVDLVRYCSSSSSVSSTLSTQQETKINKESSQGKAAEDYYWYLRSLGDEPRGKDISDLSTHFPELYKDLKIPRYFPEEAFFSSVFRISSPSLQLWTHYDIQDNILIQIRGRKRVVFFPPSEALNLYLDGDKSQVLDVDSPDLNLYPNWEKVEKFEGILEEGDIVFIPALWFHNITALDYSISVNVFWKNLEANLYDKKDTYGNKDLIPAQLAFKTFEKATAQLKVLPNDYEDFYLRRMIILIQKRLDQLSKST